MRVPNDKLLAEEVGEIDIILGGHDHDYEIIKVSKSSINLHFSVFFKYLKMDFHECISFLKLFSASSTPYILYQQEALFVSKIH